MDYNDISIKQIGYFLAVAKHLSFTAAAKDLYISQSALSKQIFLFEKSLNAKLFIRDKRTVTLTPAGLLLKDEFTHIIKKIDNALENVKFVNEEYKAKLKIGCLEGIDTSEFLMKSVDLFRESYPDVMISFEKHPFKELKRLQDRGELDIIFTLSFEAYGDDSISYKSVWKTGTCVIMSTKHQLSKKEPLLLEDFREQPFVMLSRDNSPKAFDSIVALCDDSGFTPRVNMFVPNIESLILCVEANLGVGIVDENIVLSANSKIKKWVIDEVFVSVLAIWKNNNSNPALKLFLKTLL